MAATIYANAKEYKACTRYWQQLEAQQPRSYELCLLLLHLKWLRLPAEAKQKTEFLPGMGRRRGDRRADEP